ncbi:MAG: hypothetical protein S4CHLAM37_00370 [Chlamydiia bacterium]|nr:hypothetical protein [Chlamydiia bacterium]
MILPESLVAAIEEMASHVDFKKLIQATEDLSNRYRSQGSEQETFIQSPLERIAYICMRMPATYSAVYFVLKELVDVFSVSDIRSVLDLGSGTGAGFWAAERLFDDLKEYTFVEQDNELCKAALHLIENHTHKVGIKELNQDYTSSINTQKHDLVLFSYTLSENSRKQQDRALDNALELCKRFLVVIEPGTVLGYEHLMETRNYLLSKEMHLVAPCPHSKACPMKEGKWCHFYKRLPRMALQKKLKKGSLGYEDEKFSYLVFSNKPYDRHYNRLVEFPKKSPHLIEHTFCTEEGSIERVQFPKRDKTVFKKSKKLDWGDVWLK